MTLIDLRSTRVIPLDRSTCPSDCTEDGSVSLYKARLMLFTSFTRTVCIKSCHLFRVHIPLKASYYGVISVINMVVDSLGC